jgi:hypothetical protein
MVTCWSRFSRQYTPCNFSAHSSHLYFDAPVRPLLDYIGPYPRGLTDCVPTEPRTKHFSVLKIPQYPLYYQPAHLASLAPTPASCVAMTPGLQECLLRFENYSRHALRHGARSCSVLSN